MPVDSSKKCTLGPPGVRTALNRAVGSVAGWLGEVPLVAGEIEGLEDEIEEAPVEGGVGVAFGVGVAVGTGRTDGTSC